MRFEEAYNILSEVLERLEAPELEYSLLKQLKGGDSQQDEYSLEIRAFLGTERKHQIYKIVKKHYLTLHEGEHGLTIIKKN